MPEKRDKPKPKKDDGVVVHTGPHRGPVHSRFPGLNISATAERYGVCKSHLARLLKFERRPSANTLRMLSEILSKPVEEVMALYEAARPTAPKKNSRKPKAKKRTKK